MMVLHILGEGRLGRANQRDFPIWRCWYLTITKSINNLEISKEDFNMLFLQITTFSVIVTLLLLLILSMHERNSTSLAFILQKMGKDFCDFFETTTTPAYLPLSFFFFFCFLRFMWSYKEMLDSVYSNNSSHVSSSQEHCLLLTFQAPLHH